MLGQKLSKILIAAFSSTFGIFLFSDFYKVSLKISAFYKFY